MGTKKKIMEGNRDEEGQLQRAGRSVFPLS